MLLSYMKEHNLEKNFEGERRLYIAFDFLKFLKDLNLKLKYIKSGSTGHCFKAYNENFTCAIKVVAYSNYHEEKYGDIFNKYRPENVELFVLNTLNKIPNFRHVTKIYGGFYTNIDTFSTIKINPKKIKEFKKNITIGKFDPICSILISEYCELGDLHHYLEQKKSLVDDKFFKNIFFQIILSLVIIQDSCPTFKHNDLKCNNILLQTTEPDVSHFEYRIGSNKFKLPNIGLCIKLWDFDFSTLLPCYNLKVRQNWAKDLNINEESNLYYDLHFFFNSLINIFPELTSTSRFGIEIKEFIDFVLPKMYRYRKKKEKFSYRLKYNHEYITPLYLLQIHHYFNEFKEI